MRVRIFGSYWRSTRVLERLRIRIFFCTSVQKLWFWITLNRRKTSVGRQKCHYRLTTLHSSCFIHLVLPTCIMEYSQFPSVNLFFKLFCVYHSFAIILTYETSSSLWRTSYTARKIYGLNVISKLWDTLYIFSVCCLLYLRKNLKKSQNKTKQTPR